MDKLQRGRFRLVLGDPPYDEGVECGFGAAADKLGEEKYRQWTARWLEEAAPLLTADGSLWVLISDRKLFDVLQAGRGAGLHPLGWVVWVEWFGVYRADYFGRCARYLIHFCKDPRNYVFNGDAIRVPSRRQWLYGEGKRAPGRVGPDGMVPPNVWDDIPRVAGTPPPTGSRSTGCCPRKRRRSTARTSGSSPAATTSPVGRWVTAPGTCG